MQHVFGPVPSRRLGQSLGIDPIPFKICNWNCVYCQLGRTSPLVHERQEYIPADEILAEVQVAVAVAPPEAIDWLTFVGSGEPTLHSRLGYMIRRLKAAYTIPVAVITNGSLLYDPEVRAELTAADAVLPSLDAGSDRLYRQINRPLPQLDFEQFVSGLVDFRREYRGHYWVEVMLVKGLNDADEAMHDLARVLQRIQPDEVQINVPVRPPCEPWVEPPDEATLARAREILGATARPVPVAHGPLDLTGVEHVVDAVVAIITRHPLRDDELYQALARWSAQDVQAALEQLQHDGRAQRIQRHGEWFWSCTAARYVDEAFSRRHRPTIH